MAHGDSRCLQVLETMRTLFVWAGGLALFYCSATGKIGERWDNYSYFQVQFWRPVKTHVLILRKAFEIVKQQQQRRRPDRRALGQ